MFIVVLLCCALFCIALLVLLLLVYIKYKFGYWRKRNVPYIEPRVPFGNLQSPKKRTCSIGIHLKNLYEYAKSQQWQHLGIYFFANASYMPIDLEYLKHILVTDFGHFVDRGMYYNEKDDPISAHLFAIGGEKWSKLRPKVTPVFSPKHLKNFVPLILDCVTYLHKAIDQSRNPVDIKEYLGRFTTDVIGTCAFGLQCKAIEEEDSPFREYGKKILFASKWRTFKLTLATSFPKVARFLGVRQVSKDVADFYRKVVLDTIQHRRQNVPRHDFIQMLIGLMDRGILNVEEVVAQAFVFFPAGFETSSITMTFALYELARNPAIQERLRAEIDNVLSNQQITSESLKEMRYLSQVIKETLRKYPPFPFFTRTCTEDYHIPNSDVVIEKGRRIIIPILGLHYDPEYFPEPQKFDPDRFSDENRQQIPSMAYIPFGEGQRTCIGKSFGLLQVKIGLVSLLQKYRIKVNEKTEDPLAMIKNSFLMLARNGIWLDFDQR